MTTTTTLRRRAHPRRKNQRLLQRPTLHSQSLYHANVVWGGRRRISLRDGISQMRAANPRQPLQPEEGGDEAGLAVVGDVGRVVEDRRMLRSSQLIKRGT